MCVKFLNDKDVATLLGISLSRLRVKLTSGEPLPDRIQPPSCRHRLWPEQEVYEWLERYKVSSSLEKPQIRKVQRK